MWHISRQFFAQSSERRKDGEREEERVERERNPSIALLIGPYRTHDRQVLWTTRTVQRKAGRSGEQSAESAFNGRKAEEISRLYHCNILESNYRPTNLITASEGAGARTDAGRDG